MDHLPLWLLVFFFAAFSSLRVACSSPSSSVCPVVSEAFPFITRSQCPLTIFPNPLIEVDGDFLERVIVSKQRDTYTSVLFYASWCPFSRSMRPKFETLNVMFPQIDHLVVKQSYAIPSVFSRFGIHSVPSILIVNQTSTIRYQGPKDLISLLGFYWKTTGLAPFQNLSENAHFGLIDTTNSIPQFWSETSIEEIVKQEPYLVLSVLFVCLKMLVFISPAVLSRLKALFISYIPRSHFGILGETSQFFGHTILAVDVKNVWNKLRRCKTRNLHARAKNAKLWASSFASVSLGESSSVRALS